MSPRRGWLPAVAACTVVAAATAAETGDYRFDLAEIEARPYELAGFVEAKAEHLRLNPQAPLYALGFGGSSARRTLDRVTGTVELAASFRHETLTAYARASGEATHDAYGTRDRATLLEGGMRVSPSRQLSFDVGKQVLRWGKGYAWNPVGFFERPKDPNDPQLSREGFVMASADGVSSREGALAAVGLTPVLLPASEDVNGDYGARGHVNAGARLYLLYADTDIDLLWAARGSRPQRVGVDFSRNLGGELEVHGEWARAFSAPRIELGADGVARTRVANADRALVGLRYLTEREVTWIAELYYNGAGYDEDQLARFYQVLGDAFGPGGSPALQALAASLARSGYGAVNPGRRYAYLRVAAKDPFDWLYVSPGLTTIVNLDDRSAQLTPEVVYTGWQDVELRVRAVLLHGEALSEFGAKPASRRLEVQARLYF